MLAKGVLQEHLCWAAVGDRGYLGLAAGCHPGTHHKPVIAGITILISAVLKQDKSSVWIHLRVMGSEQENIILKGL